MIKETNTLMEKALQDLKDSRVKVKEDAFVAKLQEILEFKQQAEKKREEALETVDAIQKQIDDLNNEYIQETDPKKLTALSAQRKELRIDLEDNKGIADTKFMVFVKEKMDEIEEMRGAVHMESMKYKGQVQTIENEFKQVESMAKEKKREAEILQRASSNEIERLEKMIKSKPKHERLAQDKNDNTILASSQGFGWSDVQRSR